MVQVENIANRNRSLAVSLSLLVGGMLLLAFASVPLYRLFCQVTGFGGATLQADKAPSSIGARLMTVEFNTDIDSALEWKFASLQKKIDLKPGEQKLAFFAVTNNGNTATSGTAVFNVTPHKAGQYFMKVQCFCYDEQRIPPGKTVNLPVSFFIDPAIENDPNMADVHTITLSYTFFKTKHPKITVAE